jgi:hypothetical protein
MRSDTSDTKDNKQETIWRFWLDGMYHRVPYNGNDGFAINFSGNSIQYFFLYRVASDWVSHSIATIVFVFSCTYNLQY